MTPSSFPILIRVGLLPRALPILVAAAFVAGCAAPSVDDPADAAAPASENDWGDSGRRQILQVYADILYEFDVLCLTGGGSLLPRDADGPLVPAGTDHLELAVQADATFTGLQIGYVVDADFAADEVAQEDITWLPAVRGAKEVFTVPVPTDAVEHDQPLWAFYHRMQPVAEAADCYTGGGTGKWSVIVEAIRGAPSPASRGAA